MVGRWRVSGGLDCVLDHGRVPSNSLQLSCWFVFVFSVCTTVLPSILWFVDYCSKLFCYWQIVSKNYTKIVRIVQEYEMKR